MSLQEKTATERPSEARERCVARILAPPAISDEDLDRGLEILEESLADASGAAA